MPAIAPIPTPDEVEAAVRDELVSHFPRLVDQIAASTTARTSASLEYVRSVAERMLVDLQIRASLPAWNMTDRITADALSPEAADHHLAYLDSAIDSLRNGDLKREIDEFVDDPDLAV